MSLNNILLPAGLLTHLYSHSLIDGTAISAPRKVPVAFLGGYKKQVLIIVSHDGEAFLPADDLTLLTTILGACNLSADDVAVVNWRHVSDEKHDVAAQFSPRIVLLFDVPPMVLKLYAAPQNTVQEQGGVQYIQSAALAAIAADKQLKSRLWLALKQLFGLK